MASEGFPLQQKPQMRVQSLEAMYTYDSQLIFLRHRMADLLHSLSAHLIFSKVVLQVEHRSVHDRPDRSKRRQHNRDCDPANKYQSKRAGGAKSEKGRRLRFARTVPNTKHKQVPLGALVQTAVRTVRDQNAFKARKRMQRRSKSESTRALVNEHACGGAAGKGGAVDVPGRC